MYSYSSVLSFKIEWIISHDFPIERQGKKDDFTLET